MLFTRITCEIIIKRKKIHTFKTVPQVSNGISIKLDPRKNNIRTYNKESFTQYLTSVLLSYEPNHVFLTDSILQFNVKLTYNWFPM